MIVAQPDRLILRSQIARFAKKLHGTVLDLGGGNGQRYKSMLSHVEKITSLDINADLNPDIVASADDIPLEDQSVDCVLCTQLLEHVAYPQKVVSEAFRIMKSGGHALVTAPQWNEMHEEPHDYFRYTRYGLQKICEDAGFKVLYIDQRGGFHSCKAQMNIRYCIDRFRPYQNKIAMCALGPLSIPYAKFAMLLDKIDKSSACSKHAIGWAFLLQKP